MSVGHTLQDMRIGLIGTGAMAEAIMRGMIHKGLVRSRQIVGYDVRQERLSQLQHDLDIDVAADIEQLMHTVDIVILAVKPQHISDVLLTVSPHIRSGMLFVSIAAGVALQRLEAGLGGAAPVMRVMPNTPALVGSGVSAMSRGAHATEQHENVVRAMFAAVGTVVSVSEELLDAVTGLSGSGPAYVCLVVEAMADGGVAAGLPRDIALRLAAETVRGTGELLYRALDHGEHPAVVRERVTSPAGTTAAGLAALESAAVRSAFAQAVCSAADRARSLGED